MAAPRAGSAISILEPNSSAGVNGKEVGKGRVKKTMGALYSLAAETADVGKDAFSPVTKDYDPWDNAFTGTIKKVVVKHKD